MELFSIVAYNFVSLLIERAVDEVQGMSFEVLLDPALAGKLDAIAAEYEPEYLTIQSPTEGVTTPNEPRTDQFSGHTFRGSTLSVTIPFSGDEQLLVVSPSSFSIPNVRFEIRGKTFVIHTAHDDNAKQRIDEFVRQMRDNFSVMRQDFSRDLPRLRQALDQAAIQRRVELERDRAYAEKLGFPVRGGK